MRTALLAAAAAGATVPGHAQRVTATSGSPAEIAYIRGQFAQIQREGPSLRRTVHDLHGFSREGGFLEGHYRGRELRKLEAQLFGESGRVRQEFYFADGRLIFIHVVHEIYDQPMSGRVAATVEHRFYLARGRLIRRVRTQRPSGRDLRMYDPEPAELLADARRFAACAAAPRGAEAECTAPEQ